MLDNIMNNPDLAGAMSPAMSEVSAQIILDIYTFILSTEPQ
jgi:hypothetical protein